jgi:hypothetical protein
VKEMNGKRVKLSLLAISVLLLVALGFTARWGIARYSTRALMEEMKEGTGPKRALVLGSTRAPIEEMKEPNLERVHHWLTLGADANARDKDGVPILVFAALGADSDVLRSILESGANVNAQVPPHGYTALMIASVRGNPTIVRLLLSRGAKVNIRSGKASGNRTALMMVQNLLRVPNLTPSEKKRYKQIEQLLLKAGAKP